MKSLLALFPFSNGLGMSLLLSCVKNLVIGNGRFLYSKRRLLTQHIREFLQVTPGPFPDFLGGAWGRGYSVPTHKSQWFRILHWPRKGKCLQKLMAKLFSSPDILCVVEEVQHMLYNWTQERLVDLMPSPRKSFAHADIRPSCWASPFIYNCQQEFQPKLKLLRNEVGYKISV